ncbi:hypothetical protein LTR29_011744 [Friedmanniomyces endolithicus]|nr:hypothetical protein LTR29_011744 [Friedmanniomyces endolithicus]
MADQSSSPLLSLPPELRNAIWTLLLVHDAKQQPAPPPPTLPTPPTPGVCANILRTCHQAHKEGTPILYGDNTFLAHTSLLAALPAFLLSTLPVRIVLPPVTHSRVAALIRRYYIHVRLDTDPRFTRLQAGESFTGAAELEIEVFQSMYGSCDFSVLRLFEGVRGVGRAVVRGSVGDGRYAEWLVRCMMSPVGSEVLGFGEECIGSQVWRAWVHGNR